MSKIDAITFLFHGRNEMRTENEHMTFIRDYTQTFTQYAWDGFEHHCVWVITIKGTSVVLVQHQFKRCFAEVKYYVGFVIKTVELPFSSECFNFGANVHEVRAFVYL